MASPRSLRMPGFGIAGAVLACAIVVLGGGSVHAQAPEKDGIFITVPNPITDREVNLIKKKLEEAVKRRGKIEGHFTIVFDFNPRGLPSGTSSFGSCRDLAKLIRNLRLGRVNQVPAAHTIAYVSNEVTRHTVLPVLACGELVMSGEGDDKRPGARIGKVLAPDDDALDASERQEYEQVAEGFTRGLVFRMIDKGLVVKKTRTKDGVIRYLSQDEIQKENDAGKDIAVDPGIPAGLEVGTTMFNSERALEYGLCKAMYNSRSALQIALKLPRRSLTEEGLAGTMVAWRIEVRGELDQGKLDSLRRRIKKALGKNANVIILQLECEGGATVDASSMARELSQLTDEQNLPVKTIAYVPPRRSLGAATFLALGCHEIVMGSDAALGDFNYLTDKSAAALKPKRDMLVKLARDQGYPPLLFDAMLNPGLVLYRVQAKTDPADFRLLTEEELKKDAAAPNPRFNQVGRIDAPPGELFKLNDRLAKEWQVASAIDVNTPEALYPLYNLEASKVRVMRDDWLDMVAEFFREPIVVVILIMLGIIGLILEIKLPGVGLPGIVSAICFVLFFWAYSFVGQFTLLAVLLFVLGLVLIGIEIFVLPGFGITGISGILLVVGSLTLVTLEKMPETSQDWLGLTGTLAMLGMSLGAALAAAFVIAIYLPSIPYANRLVLNPPGEADYEGTSASSEPSAPSPYAALLGAIGIAETSLRPAGKARFGDDFLDVIAEGDYINPGSRVQVIEIEGTRIVVKEIS